MKDYIMPFVRIDKNKRFEDEMDAFRYGLYGFIDRSKCTKPKVIFNPPATILFINGKKYVSKAHEENFDKEKGLLMCLAKANGYSHLDIKKMIKNAKEN